MVDHGSCPQGGRLQVLRLWVPCLTNTHHEVDVAVLVSEILHQFLKAVLLTADLEWEQGLRAGKGRDRVGNSGVSGQHVPLARPLQPCWVLLSAMVQLGRGPGDKC